MFDKGLTKVIKTATQRTANGEGWPWAVIGLVAYFMRRSLRYEEPSQSFTVKPGQEVTVSVREPDR
jgi:hypothetical protein